MHPELLNLLKDVFKDLIYRIQYTDTENKYELVAYANGKIDGILFAAQTVGALTQQQFLFLSSLHIFSLFKGTTEADLDKMFEEFEKQQRSLSKETR